MTTVTRGGSPLAGERRTPRGPGRHARSPGGRGHPRRDTPDPDRARSGCDLRGRIRRRLDHRLPRDGQLRAPDPWPAPGPASREPVRNCRAMGFLLVGCGLTALMIGAWRGYALTREAVAPFVHAGDPTRSAIEAARPVHARLRGRLFARRRGVHARGLPGALACAFLIQAPAVTPIS